LALGILFNPKNAREMAKGMIKTESGYIMGAVLPIIFGSLAFMHHHAFEPGPRLIIDIIGLSMILLGAYRAWFPEHWKKVLRVLTTFLRKCNIRRKASFGKGCSEPI